MGRKRKTKQDEVMVEAPEVFTPVPIAEVKTQRPTFIKDPICPRCGAARSRVYRTVNTRQYRECISPVCRKKFTSDAIALP